VFAVAAGVLMLRGSVTATALVRWTVAFTLASIMALALVVLLLFPMDLWRTVYRLYPGWSNAALAVVGVLLVLFAWMARELEREPVRALLAAAGKGWGLRGAWASGAGMMLLVGGLFALLLNGGLAAEATTQARAQAGPGYRYQVLILVASFDSRGIKVDGSWSRGTNARSGSFPYVGAPSRLAPPSAAPSGRAARSGPPRAALSAARRAHTFAAERLVQRVHRRDRDAVQAQDQVAGLQPRQFRRAAGLDRLDSHRGVLAERPGQHQPAVQRGIAAGHAEQAAPHAAMPQQLRDHPVGDVDRHRKADRLRPGDERVLTPITCPRELSSGPPELPGLSEASVWITSGIRPPGAGAHAAPERAHDAGRDGVLEAERIADRDGDLAAPHVGRAAQRRGHQGAARQAVDLQHGQVGVGIVADPARAELAPVGERGDALGAGVGTRPPARTTWELVSR
jgi:hypothetical protein